ncbi:MAG: signal peptidase II [Lachnospiraceae bacterium]|jgi:signal peptidase II|nr:signal peptidase II [Lachnospiraceae bacterium]
MPQNAAPKQNTRAGGAVLICDAAAFVLLILLDQFTKYLAAVKLKGKQPFDLIPGVLQFRYLENTGAAFSLFQNCRIFFIVIAFAAIVLIAWLLVKAPVNRRFLPMRICFVAIASGAAGNMADRLTLRYVRDFIYFSPIDFPIFNVADCYVSVATVLLALLVIFKYKEDDFRFLKRS